MWQAQYFVHAAQKNVGVWFEMKCAGGVVFFLAGTKLSEFGDDFQVLQPVC